MTRDSRKRFLEFQKRQLELSKQTQKEARLLKVRSNYDRWRNDLPNTLKVATPKNTPESLLAKMRDVNIKPPFEKSCIITSSDSNSSLFTAHVLIDVLIKQGVATPSQIKRSTLLDGYNNVNGMFESRKWKEYFFDDESKVLLIENSSRSLTSMAPRGEDQFWKELIEMNRYKEKFIIITYTRNKEESEKDLFIPNLTNDVALNAEIVKSSKFLTLTDREEEAIKNVQSKAFEL